MLNLLKRLFAGGGGGATAVVESDPEDYQGFQIVATPRQVSGGWSTEGIIRKEIEGTLQESTFIRADTSMSRDDAVQVALSKGRKIIDEQGERLFR